MADPNKFWRELVRVERKEADRVYVVIPAYSPHKKLDFAKSEFSEADWKALKGRCFAEVNSDAESDLDIKIKNVETPIDAWSPEELIAEIVRLRTAIREHYNQTTGHSMCWQNDEALWQKLDPSLKFPHSSMPSKEEMLGQCAVYVESRLKGLDYSEPPVKTHAVTVDGKRVS
jgi:hypothetical protein